MTIEQYISRLSSILSGFDREETENVIQYYTELLEDAENLEEQMAKLGTPEQLAQKIISENDWTKPGAGAVCEPPSQPNKRKMTAGRVIALICTSPLWITVYTLILSLLIVIWSVYICFPVIALAGLIGSLRILKIYTPYSIEYAAAAISGAAFTVLLWRPVIWASRGVIQLWKSFSGFLFLLKNSSVSPHKSKPFNKAVMIASAAALGFGVILGNAVYFIAQPNEDEFAQKLGLENYEYEYSDTIQSFNISVKDFGEFRILPGDGSKIKLTAKNIDTDKLTVSDGINGAINYENKEIDLQFFNIHYPEARFTLYLPRKQYDKLNINVSAGDLEFEGISANSLEIDCGLGEVSLKNCKMNALTLCADMGDIKITDCTIDSNGSENLIEAYCGNVTVKGLTDKNMKINNRMGNIKIANSDFDSLNTYIDCGNAELKDVSVGGELIVNNDMGDADFNNVTAGSIDCVLDCGDLEYYGEITGINSKDSTIEMGMGDADMELTGNDYNVKADTDMGSVKINGKSPSMAETDGNIIIRIHNQCGDIDVEYH